MLTSKQRAFLRGLASTQNTVFQIGKGGLSDNQILEIERLLESHELVKIHVLENALVEARDMCAAVAESIDGCEPVCAIGRRFVIYKQSKENKRIDLKNLRVLEPEKKETKKLSKPNANKEKAFFKNSFSKAPKGTKGARGGFGRKRNKSER